MIQESVQDADAELEGVDRDAPSSRQYSAAL